MYSTGKKPIPVNKKRTKGSDPLSRFSPRISRGSGNLIPVGATKHPKTGRTLTTDKQGPKPKAKSKVVATMTSSYKNSATGKVTKGKTRKMTGKTITEKEFNK